MIHSCRESTLRSNQECSISLCCAWAKGCEGWCLYIIMIWAHYAWNMREHLTTFSVFLAISRFEVELCYKHENNKVQYVFPRSTVNFNQFSYCYSLYSHCVAPPIHRIMIFIILRETLLTAIYTGACCIAVECTLLIRMLFSIMAESIMNCHFLGQAYWKSLRTVQCIVFILGTIIQK